MKAKSAYGVLLGSMLLQCGASAQFVPGARSAGDPYLPGIGNGGYDVQHYDLTIDYDPGTNAMMCRAVLTMRATQSLSEFSLDLRGFPGATVTVDGEAAEVVQSGDKLMVTPAAGILDDRLFHAVVNYSGRPSAIQDPDGSFEGWVRIADGGFVVNEPMGAMGWFPNNNTPSDKATYDFHITVPDTHTALGNGELVSKVENGDGTLTWNWHMGFPMATYLSTATVGRFDFAERLSTTALGGTGDPLEIYDAFESALSASRKTAAATVADRQDEIVQFIAGEIGAPYPYESLGIVLHRNSLGYALEVQTKPHFSATPIDPRILVHEIAHQWFGNSVGPATWREIWFNEGWATWWEWYWSNKQNGSTRTVEQRFSSNYDSTARPERWNTPPANLPSATELFSRFPVYTRPAMMIEAYRQIVGDAAFVALQHALVTEYAYSSISGEQFIALAKHVAQERSGFEGAHLSKLDEFFQQWLHGGVKPALTAETFFEQLPPPMAIRLTRTSELELAWPAAAVGFSLEESHDLSSASWTLVSSLPTVTNGEAKVTLARPQEDRFYRLRRD